MFIGISGDTLKMPVFPILAEVHVYMIFVTLIV